MQFALHAPDATEVRLCLFERPDSAVARREIPLRRYGDGTFRRRLRVPDGTLYGYRVDGPYAPRRGLRFNPGKLLVDPYARAITGEPRWSTSLFGTRLGDAHPLSYNGEDSAGDMPKCIVVDDAFDWQGVTRPTVPWSDTVIYECHVQGMTQLHDGVDPELRGTYRGLASSAVLEHWKRLGVTSVQLMPVQQIASEVHLMQSGRCNYWGYSTLGFFAPHAGYATVKAATTGGQVHEFKTMVRELHRAGFEVFMDVVYNHTPEGDHLGPTLSLRGIDNRGFYRLGTRSQERYVDFTGCGNSLDIGRPACRRLVLDSLRYWVGEMQVDGFRFDLAPFLGRESGDFDGAASFFKELDNDPLLAGCKWIAEPWDLGPHGYRLGQFPQSWREWNDRYRIDVRRFWRGRGADAGHLRRRMTGSPDVFGHKGRSTSINYVVSHDGYTLADLVSYEQKHNEANGEDNRDGSNDDTSCHWGHEGPTQEASTLEARHRARRNLLSTLLLSRGTPMLAHGDEMGRSQGGNNNPYNQDNATTWVDWTLLDQPDGADLCRWVSRLLALRRKLDGLRGLEWPSADEAVSGWTPAGESLEAGELDHLQGVSLGLRWQGPEGEVLVLCHGAGESLDWRLPDGRWRLWLDTASGRGDAAGEDDLGEVSGHIPMTPFSLCLLLR